MIGNPKYTEGDIVKFFDFYNEEKTGIVVIVDENGTFYDPNNVYYDIRIKEEHTLYKYICLYKHICESNLIEKIGEVNPDTVWD